MPRPEHLDEVYALAPEIQESTPERCQPCFMPESAALNLARRVINGQITLEQAKQAQADEFEDCRYGAIQSVSGGVECRLGVLCEFIPRPGIIEGRFGDSVS